MSTKSNKKDNKNIKALFSVICLCIISLGLIVYFSTNSKSQDNTVNEPTTIQETTDVQHAVTVKETTAKAKEKTTKKAKAKKKKKESTTVPTTMNVGENNIPFKSFYKYPLTESVVKGYSEELVYDETMGDYRAHIAVDFSGTKGDEVVAVNDGLVLSVNTDNMLGTVVEIDHGGTFIVKYCGLDSVSVKKGQIIDIGKKIGTLGAVPMESADASHLHLEATYDGKPVNPLNVMGKTE